MYAAPMMTADNRTTTILEQRRARGWSRARLAREAGITEQTIVRAEKGLVQTSLETIHKIAAAFDLPADALVLERAHTDNVPVVSVVTPDDRSAA